MASLLSNSLSGEVASLGLRSRTGNLEIALSFSDSTFAGDSGVENKLGARRIIYFFGASREKTGAAVDGSALRRIKRHRSLLPTLCALNRNLDSLSHPGGLSGGNSGQPFVLCLLTGFATLRLVFQSLVMEKGLFT